MDTNHQIGELLISTLGKTAKQLALHKDTPLLGAIPEFDSMAVASIIMAIEDHFGIMLDDDELNAEVFETFGSLCGFVSGKV